MLRARDATRALGAASAQRFQARSPASAAAPAPPEAPEPLDPAQAVADAAAAAAGGRVRPCAAAPRPGRGREAGRAPARARARAPAAGASQVVRARVLAAGLRAAARQRSSFRLARGSQASRPIERGSELQWRWPRRRAGVASAASTPPSSAEERQGAEPGGNQAVASPYHPLGSARRARGVSVAWGPGGGMPRPSI